MDALVPAAQRIGHGCQVVGIEGDSHRQTRGTVQAGGRGVALGQQHQAARCRHADQVEVPFLDQAGRPVFLFLCARLAVLAADDLQPMDVALHVQQRYHHGPAGRVAHAVAGNALTRQVFALAGGLALLPCLGSPCRGARGVCLSGSFGAALVLGQAAAQGLGLFTA